MPSIDMEQFNDLRGPPGFNPEGEPATISIRWEKWLEEFEAFADCKGLFNIPVGAEDTPALKNDRTRRRALLMYVAGARVREIFRNLDKPGSEANKPDDYVGCVKILDDHFKVKKNVVFQRHLFRATRQNSDETVGQYIQRLRTASDGCEFDKDLDNNIRDQLVSGIRSDKIRRKMLSADDLTLTKAEKMATQVETLDMQYSQMSVGGKILKVNQKSKPNQKDKPRTPPQSGTCTRCGREHGKSDCRAVGKECHKCGKMNHFSHMCRSSSQDTGNDSASHSKSQGRRGGYSDRKSGRTQSVGNGARRQVHTLQEDDCESSDGYTFQVTGVCHGAQKILTKGSTTREKHPWLSRSQSADGPFGADVVKTDPCDEIQSLTTSHQPATVILSDGVGCGISDSGIQDDTTDVLAIYPQKGNVVYQVERDDSKIEVQLGGVQIVMTIDSGSTANIVSKPVWEYLKSEKIKAKTRPSNKRLFPYTSDTALSVCGIARCSFRIGDNEVVDDLTVIDHKAESLLSRETAKQLGVLKMGVSAVRMVSPEDVSEKVFKAYPEVFQGIGKLKHKQIKLSIDPDVKPVAQPYRRVPFGLREKLDKKLEELLEADIIESVNEPSEWVSPIVVSPKKNGEIRQCVDMRRANQAILRERQPINTVDEIIHEMTGCVLFTKLDMKWGFHQLELDVDSRAITTFASHRGLYRYKRLMFGVSSAPEIYNHEVRKIISGIPGCTNMADDIIIYAKSEKEHDSILTQVLQRLRDAGLTLNRDKCSFKRTEVNFVGHKISGKGVDVLQNHVDALKRTAEPKSAAEVRSFLGLAQYVSKFIPDYANVSEPLREACRKQQKFNFGDEQRSAFRALKESMSTRETLGFFDPTAETRLISDASPVGLGAVLVQHQASGPRIISYAGRTLTDVERRYSQCEREALALVWSCEKFASYLIGLQFKLVTDNQALKFIFSTTSKPCARIERWVLRLQSFDYVIEHIKGPNNIADSLSRLVGSNTIRPDTSHDFVETDEHVKMIVVSSTPRAMSINEIGNVSATDPELSELREAIECGKAIPAPYSAIQTELCVSGRLVLRGNRIIIPQKLRGRCVELAHEGHPGIVGTKQRARTKVWWPGIDRSISSFVSKCHECQITSRGSPPEPLRPTPFPTGAWKDVAIDYLGPLPSGEYILVVVDYYSRFYDYAITKDISTTRTIEKLSEIFFRYGVVESLKSDNGPQFRSAQFTDYMSSLGIDHYRTTPRFPQANGEVERQNASLKRRIQMSPENWKHCLANYVMAYRTITHPATGKSPSELMFGRSMKYKLPEFSDNHGYFDQEARDNDAVYKAKMKARTDSKRNAVASDIGVGDIVLVERDTQTKTQSKYHPEPMIVTARRGGRVSVELEGVKYDRDVSRCKQYLPPSESITGDVESQTAEPLMTNSPTAEIANDHTEPRRNDELLRRDEELPRRDEELPRRDEELPRQEEAEDEPNDNRSEVPKDSTPVLRRSTRKTNPIERYGFP